MGHCCVASFCALVKPQRDLFLGEEGVLALVTLLLTAVVKEVFSTPYLQGILENFGHTPLK